MANLKLHRWLIGIFTSIIVIFAMSHNASAVDNVYDLSNYSSHTLFNRVNLDCIVDGVTSTNVGNCSSTSVNTNHDLSSILSHNTMTFKANDIIEFDLVIFSSTPINTFRAINFQYDTSNFRLLGFKDVTDNTLYDVTYLDVDATSPNQGNISGGNYYSKIVRFNMILLKDFTGPIGFSSNSTAYPVFNFDGLVNFKFFNCIRYRKNAENDTNAEQKEATEDAVEDSENAGNSSSSSAESGSASLLNVITAFAGIITSAQPTNCKINGNMGNLNIGQIDLCANPVPSFVQIIGSIILVCLVIPFVVIMFNRFISIFRSFQS